KLWDTETGKAKGELTGHADLVRTLAFNPKSAVLASGCKDGTLKLWDTESAKCLTTVQFKDLPVLALAIAPDGKTLAMGRVDSKVRGRDVGESMKGKQEK